MYSRSRSMVAMMEMKTGRYMCPNHCGRSYKNKGGVSQHLTYECGVEPKFKCSKCGKKFAQKSRIKSHMITVHKTLLLI